MPRSTGSLRAATAIWLSLTSVALVVLECAAKKPVVRSVVSSTRSSGRTVPAARWSVSSDGNTNNATRRKVVRSVVKVLNRTKIQSNRSWTNRGVVRRSRAADILLQDQLELGRHSHQALQPPRKVGVQHLLRWYKYAALEDYLRRPTLLKFLGYVSVGLACFIALLVIVFRVFLWLVLWKADATFARCAQEALASLGDVHLRNARSQFTVNFILYLNPSYPRLDAEQSCLTQDINMQYWNAASVDDLDQLFDIVAAGKKELSKVDLERVCLAVSGSFTELEYGDVYPVAPVSTKECRWLLDHFEETFPTERPLGKETFKGLIGLLLAWMGARAVLRMVIYYQRQGTPWSRDDDAPPIPNTGILQVPRNLIGFTRQGRSAEIGLRSAWRVVYAVQLGNDTPEWELEYMHHEHQEKRIVLPTCDLTIQGSASARSISLTSATTHPDLTETLDS